MTISREQAAQARRAAAYERMEQSQFRGDVQARRSAMPGLSRSLAFPTKYRSELVERNGSEYNQLTGVASVTDQPYDMFDMFGEYTETIERGAFTETLASNPDVVFLVNHKGLSMARTTNGSLMLRMGDTGLESDAYLNPKRTDVADLLVAIDDRTVTEMSFAFMLEDGLWSEDFTEFTITKLSIDRGDVSAVNYGANPYTSISARELDDMARLPAGAARAVVERLGSRGDLVATSPEPAPVTPVTTTTETRGPAMLLDSLSAWITLSENPI
jgi:HK97 family phage prohead protease